MAGGRGGFASGGRDDITLTVDVSELEKRLREAETQSARFIGNQFQRVTEDAMRKEHELAQRRQKFFEGFVKQNEQLAKFAKEELDLLNKKYDVAKKIVGVGGGRGKPPGGDRDDDEDDNTEQNRYRKRARARRMAAFGTDVGRVANQWQQAEFQGYTGSSVMRLAGAGLNMIPVAGPLFDTAANLAANEMGRTEKMQIGRYRGFRRFGEGYYQQSKNFRGDTAFRKKMIMQGLSEDEVDATLAGTAEAGIGRMGFDRASNTLAGLQSGFGLGKEGAGLLGSVKRAGVADDKQALDSLGAALGVAMTTGLEKARVGEAFANLARAAQSVTDGTFSLAAASSLQAFVGKMGPAYQGSSTAGVAAQDMLTAMGRGEAGGMSQVLALRAAGFKGGGMGNYATARINMMESGGQKNAQKTFDEFANLPDVRKAWGPGTKPGRSPEKDTAATKYSEDGKVFDPIKFMEAMDAKFYGAGTGDYISAIAGGLTGMLRGGAFTDKGGHDIGRARAQASGQKVVDTDPIDFDEDRTLGAFLGGLDPRGNGWGIGEGGMGNQSFLRSMSLATPSASTKRQSLSSMQDAESGALARRGVGSTAEAQFESRFGYGHANMNFGQVRNTKKVNGIYVPGESKHEEQDIYFPPGTAILTPEAGKVVDVGQAMRDKKYGSTVIFRGNSGRVHNWTHLEPDSIRVSKGGSYPVGHQVGITLNRERFDMSKPRGGDNDDTHLHYGLKDAKGHDLLASRTLGASGMNALTGGRFGIGGAGGDSGHVEVVLTDNRASVRTTGSAFKANGTHTGSK